jgi:WD40 repeat protein
MLPTPVQRLVNWLIREEHATLTEAAAHLGEDEATTQARLTALIEQGYVQSVTIDGQLQYCVRLATRAGRQMPNNVWQVLESKSGTANVFISYSRRNKAFVKRLYESLSQRQRQVWVDWENIPIAADWWQEIQLGIEVADTFIFVLSPDSVKSEVCRQEIEHAVQHHKRLLPLVHQDVEPHAVHPELAKLNWLFFRAEDDFNAALSTLVKTIDTDLDYVRTHTRLLIRANEWDKKLRDDSFLLRGTDLQDAQHWLTRSIGKAPQPTPLQQDYIAVSFEVETVRREEELEHQRDEIRWQRWGLLVVGLISIVVTGLGLFAFWQYQRVEKLLAVVERDRLIATSRTSEALFVSGQTLNSLVEGLKAGIHLRQADPTPTQEVQTQVKTVLQQALYWVQERNRLESGSAVIYAVAFSPNQQPLHEALIATASEDRTVKLWRADGTLIDTLTGHGDAVNSVVFSPDGQTIATASADRSVKLWNRDGTLIDTLTGHGDAVNSVVFSPDGQTIATASADNTVKLWRTDGTLVRTLAGHQNWVSSVAFSPDGQTVPAELRGALIASASDDRTVKLWNRDGTLIHTLTGHSEAVVSVVFSPDGQTIATASADNTVKLWRTDGTLVRTLTGHSDRVWAVRFSPDGQTIATASFDNTVKLWRTDGTLLTTLTGHNDWVSSLTFSADGQFLASGSWDGTVKLWQVNPALLNILVGHRDWVKAVSISSDGQTIATASADRSVKLWNRDGTLLTTLHQQQGGHQERVDGVAFSPDGQTIATASADRSVKLWNRDGTLLRTLNGHTAAVTAVSFSPDGKIASVGFDDTVRLWRADGTPLATFAGHRERILAVRFSPDGRLIATASADRTVKLWRTDGTQFGTLTGHQGDVTSVAFSPDGQLIATASADGTAKLWRIDGAQFRTLTGHRAALTSVVFSPDGHIATASYDRTVKLWHADGRLLTTLSGHRAGVTAVTFSPDQQAILTASDDQTAIIWNLNQMQDLDYLLSQGCRWIRDYLRSNPRLSETDRQLCQTIASQDDAP